MRRFAILAFLLFGLFLSVSATKGDQLLVTLDLTRINANNASQTVLPTITLLNVTDPTANNLYSFNYAGAGDDNGFTLNVSAISNVSGESTLGFLNTQGVSADNVNNFRYSAKLTFQSIGYEFPSSSNLSAEAVFGVTSVSGNTAGSPSATMSAFVNSEQIGSNTIFNSVVPNVTATEALSSVVHPYTLKTVYDFFLFDRQPNGTGPSTSINVFANLKVNGETVAPAAVPEASNVVSAAVMLIPVGLFCLGMRRRKMLAAL
jgi:hypothetical protein